MELPYYCLLVKDLIHSPRVFSFCSLKYPGHNKGCPNYNRVDKCPPKTKYITEILDLTKPIYLVYSEYDVESFALSMKIKHDDWSDRKCRCALYWQPKSRAQLAERVKECISILKNDPNFNINKIISIPEAHGVNLYLTAKRAGLKLEKIKGLKICHHIALLGISLEQRGLL